MAQSNKYDIKYESHDLVINRGINEAQYSILKKKKV